MLKLHFYKKKSTYYENLLKSMDFGAILIAKFDKN